MTTNKLRWIAFLIAAVLGTGCVVHDDYWHAHHGYHRDEHGYWRR